MGRIRTIKPEFFTHEGLYDLEKETGLPVRLAFAGLWTQADKEGRFAWRPRVLKPHILPHDDVDFPKILDALHQAGFLEKYEVNGKTYGAIPTWCSHQKPHCREAASLIPPPPVTTKAMTAHCLGDADDSLPVQALQTLSSIPGGREGKGREGNGEGEGKGTAPPSTEPTNFASKATDALDVSLAELWCFHSTRKKFGASRDQPADMRVEFGELLRLGKVTGNPRLTPEKLKDCILEPGRDHGEFFWQFKDRLIGKSVRPTDGDQVQRLKNLIKGKPP